MSTKKASLNVGSLASRPQRPSQAPAPDPEAGSKARLWVLVPVLIVLLIAAFIVWGDPMPMTVEMRAGIYGGLITLALCTAIFAATMWLYNREALGKETVHGLRLQIEQERRAHSEELRAARTEATQAGAAKRQNERLAAEAEKQLGQLRRQLKAAAPKARQFDEQREQLEADRAAAAAALAAAEHARKEAEAAAAAANETAQTSRRQADAMLGEVRNQHEQVQRQRTRLASARRRRAEQLSRLRKELQMASARLADQEQAVARALEPVRTELEDARAAGAAAGKRVSELEAELAATREELTAAQNNLADAWCVAGEEQEASTSATERLSAAIAALEEALQVPQAERFSAADKSLKALAHHLQGLIERLGQSIEKRVADARATIVEAQRAAQARLVEQLREARNARDEAQQGLRTKTGEAAALQRTIAEHQARLARLGESHAAHVQRLSELDRSAADQERLIRELQDTKGSLEEQIRDSRRALEELRETADSAARDAAAKKAELESQLEAIRQELSALQAELAVLREAMQREAELARSTQEANQALQAEREALLAQLCEAKSGSENLLLTLSNELGRACKSGEPSQVIAALAAHDVVYQDGEWTGEKLPVAQQALVFLGRDAATALSRMLGALEAEGTAIDPDDPEADYSDELEEINGRMEQLQDLIAGAVSRYSAVDFFLSLSPKRRHRVVDSDAMSLSFVRLLIALFLSGRRKCRFILSSDAYLRVRDAGLHPAVPACLYAILRDERCRTARQRSRNVQLRATVMLGSVTLLRAVLRMNALTNARAANREPVQGDPYHWSLRRSIAAAPHDRELEELLPQARQVLSAMWWLPPHMLRELWVEIVGDASRDAIRAGGGGVGGQLGFHPSYALALLPVDVESWHRFGDRAAVYGLLELSSLDHPPLVVARAPREKLGKPFDPYKAVVLEWLIARNAGHGARLAPATREALRVPRVNAERFAAFAAQFYADWADARKTWMRILAAA